jgi:hypothetical protein
MMSLSKMFNPSGGLGYHLRAIRKKQLWVGHQNAVAQWLKSWHLNAEKLLLIGPSAGYSLPDEFLSQFRQVDAIDPDPLAPNLFRRIHRNINIKWHTKTALLDLHQQISNHALPELASAFPNHVFLFCNILGQLRTSAPSQPDQLNSFHMQLQQLNHSHNWASYHDLWSGQGRSNEAGFRICAANLSNKITESVQFYKKCLNKNEVIDHLTAQLFENIEVTRYQWLWQITEKQLHCIEGVRPSKQESGA